MTKIPSKASVYLSLGLSGVFFIALVFGMSILPQYVSVLNRMPEGIFVDGRIEIAILCYAILIIAMVADILMFGLLIRVRRDLVFSSVSVALIRGVSWCVIIIGLLFLVLSHYLVEALICAAAAVFLGLCLRIVKNVIETATEIKLENDFTV